MSHQDLIIKAFRDTGKDRLSVDQLVQLTALERNQVTSAAYQLKIKDVGFTEAIVKGKPRKGVYTYAEPAPVAPVSAPPVQSAPPAQNGGGQYLVLRIVATLPEGWSVALDEKSGGAYRVEKM